MEPYDLVKEDACHSGHRDGCPSAMKLPTWRSDPPWSVPPISHPPLGSLPQSPWLYQPRQKWEQGVAVVGQLGEGALSCSPLAHCAALYKFMDKPICVRVVEGRVESMQIESSGRLHGQHRGLWQGWSAAVLNNQAQTCSHGEERSHPPPSRMHQQHPAQP